jgi:exodeoxyribonuclease III
MKIVSYNVNGIRSVISKGFIDWVRAVDADIICLQEIKADLNQIDLKPFTEMGYLPFWFSAKKKGYSGVAIFSKYSPVSVTLGCGIDCYDSEGRVIRFDIRDFSIINTYMPSGSSGDIRQSFKMQWLKDFDNYIRQQRKLTENLIVCGDYNICHQSIDIHNPKSNVNSSGFLPEEREWISNFLNSGFIDTFRYFNQEPHHYTWWSYRAGARQKNLGWRIDYQMVTQSLQGRLKRCVILSDVKFSDHCPVLLELHS